MDEYAFLIELNSNLGFKFAGNAIVGDIEDLSFKISFAMNNSLKVHTKAYLDSSYPTEEHVVKALEKTGSFPSMMSNMKPLISLFRRISFPWIRFSRLHRISLLLQMN